MFKTLWKEKRGIKNSVLIKHETKRNILFRFLIVLFIFLGYLVFMNIKYGIKEGFLATILTWSFFIFCTPIADAGFLLDFPIRLITKIKMIYTESFVWVLALTVNIWAFIFKQEIYDTTKILSLFKHIITTPFPYGGIIILSFFGTFMSIYFGDELMDVVKHSHRKKYLKHKFKHKFILILFILSILTISYLYLINKLSLSF